MITTRALPALLLCAAAIAQEAPAPATAAPTPPAAGEPKSAAATPQRPSSRYHLSDVDARIATVAASFAMAKRPSDPFGLMQDPNLKPAAPKIVRGNRPKMKNIPPTPFKDVVSAIQVTAVMPSQQRFLIGDRAFHRGNRFPIHYRDKSVTVEVAKVSASSVTFRNVKTNEVANLNLTILPPGMTRGSDGVAGPPGLERDNPSAPIKVDVATPNTGKPTFRPNAALR